MNRLLRDHGFGIALVVGVVLLVYGLVASNPAALAIAVIFLVIGVVARPLEEFALNRSGFLLKWQREVVQALDRRLEDRLTISESVDATVIHGSGNLVITPAPARLRLRTFEPTVIVRPQSPDEFAETLLDQIIEPAVIASGAQVNPPSVEQDPPRDPA